jgi:predicted metalloprotease with PDZ domain
MADCGHASIAHELFHSWNGHRIAPADYASPQWLSEGFTEYFANLALVQEEVISREPGVVKATCPARSGVGERHCQC